MMRISKDFCSVPVLLLLHQIPQNFMIRTRKFLFDTRTRLVAQVKELSQEVTNTCGSLGRMLSGLRIAPCSNQPNPRFSSFFFLYLFRRCFSLLHWSLPPNLWAIRHRSPGTQAPFPLKVHRNKARKAGDHSEKVEGCQRSSTC